MAGSLKHLIKVHQQLNKPCPECGCVSIEEWVDADDETRWICADCGEEE